MFRVKIYAIPDVQLPDFELLASAIDSAKLELETRAYPAHAKITDLQSGETIVRLYLNNDGSIDDTTH